MQAIVDDLTAKKLELEAKLAQMTEKAINAATELQKVKADLEDQLNKQQITQPILNTPKIKENNEGQLKKQQITKPIPISTGSKIIYSIINDFLPSSKCATEKQQKEYLHKLLGNKRFVTILLFCGSIHGWNAKDFHSRCDKKGPTISLFKIKDGDCIGGYTKAQWESVDGGKWVDDSDAMLFNLSRQRHFTSTGNGLEIWCYSGYGPCYGNYELCAGWEPYNGDGKCISITN